MAIGTSRGGQRFSAIIWPGFVDVMTALILVLFFVLSIFMIVQFVLRDTITGQDRELDALSVQVANLADALGLERSRADREAALVATLTTAQEAADARIADFEAQVASLIARNTDISGQLEAATAESAERLSANEALERSLALARGEIDAAAEAARLDAARREALEALTASLRTDVQGLQGELDARTAALALAEGERDAEAEAARLATAQREALDALVASLRADAEALRGDLDARDAELLANTEALSEAEAARLAEAAAAQALRARLAEAETDLAALSEAEQQRLAEAAAAEALRARLAEAGTELTALTLSLEAERKRAEDTLTLLAAAEAARDRLQDDQAATLTEADRRAAELAQARALLAAEEEISAESQRQMALLNQQTAELRAQLDGLQGLLDASQARDVASRVQIERLGANLNAALARVAAEERARAEAESARAEAEFARAELEARERERLQAEAVDLERYRSEFFGRMSQILGEREGVQVVGDRFVFPSEVLFAPGSASLGAAGQAQVARVAQVIREIADEIPPGIDWVLRVDGHTDRTPVSASSQFADNWELSQARALSVVRYMNAVQGIPANRLAATGFGEYQPVDLGDSPEALARNRRIELKFTER